LHAGHHPLQPDDLFVGRVLELVYLEVQTLLLLRRAIKVALRLSKLMLHLRQLVLQLGVLQTQLLEVGLEGGGQGGLRVEPSRSHHLHLALHAVQGAAQLERGRVRYQLQLQRVVHLVALAQSSQDQELLLLVLRVLGGV